MTVHSLSKHLLFCALFAASTGACAQSQATPEQRQAVLERFQTADSNGDGFIDKAEADANLPRIAKHFDKLDSNQDGKLSPDELNAAVGRLAERRRR